MNMFRQCVNMFRFIKFKRDRVSDNAIRLNVKTFHVSSSKLPWQVITSIRGFQPSGQCEVTKNFIGQGITKQDAMNDLHLQIIKLYGYELCLNQLIKLKLSFQTWDGKR